MSKVAEEVKDNVVQLFNNLPDENLINIEKSLDVVRVVRVAKEQFCEEVTDMAMEQLLSTFYMFGTMMQAHKVNEMDILAIRFAIEGALYRYNRLDHKFHVIVDEALDFTEDEDDNDELSEEEKEDNTN